jgi:hypothetical protein
VKEVLRLYDEQPLGRTILVTSPNEEAGVNRKICDYVGPLLKTTPAKKY